MRTATGLSTILLLFSPFLSFGQIERVDKIQLKQVNRQDALAKYAYLIEDSSSSDVIKAHESIWKLASVRKVAEGLNAVAPDMETFTVTLNWPTDKEPYYFIGLYERQTQVLNKLMVYRVNSKDWTIEKKEDWETKWTKVRE